MSEPMVEIVIERRVQIPQVMKGRKFVLVGQVGEEAPTSMEGWELDYHPIWHFGVDKEIFKIFTKQVGSTTLIYICDPQCDTVIRFMNCRSTELDRAGGTIFELFVVPTTLSEENLMTIKAHYHPGLEEGTAVIHQTDSKVDVAELALETFKEM